MLAALALTAQLLAAAPATPLDTPPPRVRPRPQAVEVSEWYQRRLTIHRALSYTIFPLFAFQYAAGRELWDHGAAAPNWARQGHRVGATALAGVFTVNTVTGAWNLWDSRSVDEGRTRRYLHAFSMMVANAGFVWAGARLSEEAERDAGKRRLHRDVAISSMGISVTSAVLMWVFNK